MIGEFQRSLKSLVIDPNDQFHVHVRARLGKKATAHFERKVKEFILRMPSVVSRVDEMVLAEKEGSAAHRLAKFLLIYLYDPVDFLPEQDIGLFGYLDDAYFVANVYLKILEIRGAALRTDEDEKMRSWISAYLEPVRYLIPEESRRIDSKISDIVAVEIL